MKKKRLKRAGIGETNLNAVEEREAVGGAPFLIPSTTKPHPGDRRSRYYTGFGGGAGRWFKR